MLRGDAALAIERPEFLRTELGYVPLLFTLFVVPRLLQQYRLPQAITSVALGAAIGLTTGWFRSDPTMPLLATLGIVSLFLLPASRSTSPSCGGTAGSWFNTC